MVRSLVFAGILGITLCVFAARPAAAQTTGVVSGTVRDQTGGLLPGVTVELTAPRTPALAASTDAGGRYRFDAVAPGDYTLSFRLVNFGDQRREVKVAPGR